MSERRFDGVFGKSKERGREGGVRGLGYVFVSYPQSFLPRCFSCCVLKLVVAQCGIIEGEGLGGEAVKTDGDAG